MRRASWTVGVRVWASCSELGGGRNGDITLVWAMEWGSSAGAASPRVPGPEQARSEATTATSSSTVRIRRVFMLPSVRRAAGRHHASKVTIGRPHPAIVTNGTCAGAQRGLGFGRQ